MSRYSRLMSCAVGSTWCSGGRRSAQARPSPSSTRNVRLERPPAISVKVSGVVSSGTWSASHFVTSASLIPCGASGIEYDANRWGTRWPDGSPPDGPDRGGGRTRTPGPGRCRPPCAGPLRPIRPDAAGSVVAMDVTDQTFQEDVLTRSMTVPVVVDLWAPWCGPCKTLGPMLERAVAATDGAVELAKVNVDDNPRVAQTFQVQSIPAVFAIAGGQVVDQFIGALPEDQVTAFVQGLAPAPERGRPAGREGGRGLGAPGPRARARPRRRDRGAGPHPDRPGRRRRRRWPRWGACPRPRRAAPWPPRPACSRPGWTCRPAAASRPSWTSCSSGCARTTPPARSSSTCSRPWARTTRAPTSTGGRSRHASSDAGPGGRALRGGRGHGAVGHHARPGRPALRPRAAGPRDGHPQPHARLLLRQGRHLRARQALRPGRAAGDRRGRHPRHRRGEGGTRSRGHRGRGDGAGGAGGHRAGAALRHPGLGRHLAGRRWPGPPTPRAR